MTKFHDQTQKSEFKSNVAKTALSLRLNSLGPFSAHFSGKSDSFFFIWRFKVYVTHMDI